MTRRWASCSVCTGSGCGWACALRTTSSSLSSSTTDAFLRFLLAAAAVAAPVLPREPLLAGEGVVAAVPLALADCVAVAPPPRPPLPVPEEGLGSGALGSFLGVVTPPANVPASGMGSTPCKNELIPPCDSQGEPHDGAAASSPSLGLGPVDWKKRRISCKHAERLGGLNGMLRAKHAAQHRARALYSINRSVLSLAPSHAVSSRTHHIAQILL